MAEIFIGGNGFQQVQIYPQNNFHINAWYGNPNMFAAQPQQIAIGDFRDLHLHYHGHGHGHGDIMNDGNMGNFGGNQQFMDGNRRFAFRNGMWWRR